MNTNGIREFAGAITVACAFASCAPKPEAVAPTAPATQPQAPPTAGCDLLRDRVVAAHTRLSAIMRDSPEDAAKYYAIDDVMKKLAKDLDRPFTTDEIGALASDYREAAESMATSAHDIALLLEKGSANAKSVSASGSARRAFTDAVDGVVADCRPRPSAPDCAKVVRIMQRLGDGSPSATRIEDARLELASVQPVTPGMTKDIAHLAAALATMRDAAAVGENIGDEGGTKLVAYERSAHKFSGLNVRSDALCSRQ
jgi:hypothetical protein